MNPYFYLRLQKLEGSLEVHEAILKYLNRLNTLTVWALYTQNYVILYRLCTNTKRDKYKRQCRFGQLTDNTDAVIHLH